ncbi:hypothetical protein PPOLYM_03501 [Paenibacillus polymyxa]|uniref:helix-turn-helix domain-containing protein n=1 Tax=Paenibacillus TaxID=44249 RepID=UPI000D9781E2|nr:helix-turn-helix transcriptional regulator [Paenibacillus polymyxa]VUG07093.1 hypothetical protein PPOLYM_03501 [Paenibacillus polymyxa]
MKYSDLLKEYIKKSRLTLEEICSRLEKEGLSMSREHLSRLQNGKTPPTSDELNRAIAKVTGGDAEELIMAAYIEKAPDFVKQKIQVGEDITQFLNAALGHVKMPLNGDDPSETFEWKDLFAVINMEERLELLKIVLLDGKEHSRESDNGDQQDKRNYNNANETIRLLEEEAQKMGLSPSDPEFIEMIKDSMEIIRVARGKNKN